MIKGSKGFPVLDLIKIIWVPSLDILQKTLINEITCNTFFLVNFYAAMIIITINDICAYYVGFFAGRTPLIKLSPKKTLEVGCQKIRNTFFVLLSPAEYKPREG